MRSVQLLRILKIPQKKHGEIERKGPIKSLRHWLRLRDMTPGAQLLRTLKILQKP